MRVRIAKWGNSLALRLPKALAHGQSLREGTEVELKEHAEGILLQPVGRRYDLQALLRGVNAKNLHAAEDSGAPVGKEVW